MQHPKSILQYNPKSRVITQGYINVYTNLNSKERTQLNYKNSYKKDMGDTWDESLVWLSKRFKHAVESLRSSDTQRDIVVLDAGCGNGNYVVDENRKDISWAVGVDLDPKYTEKNVCLDEIKYAPLEKLPLDSNSVDIVLSLWVLEHVENPRKAFDEIARVLEPGGTFLFAVPNKNFLPLRLARFLKLFGISKFLTSLIFGRKEQDIFRTYYKAASIEDLSDLAWAKFEIKELRLNFDPSYTSFGPLSYKISRLIHTVFSKAGFSFTYPHIVGEFVKKRPDSAVI